MIETIGTIISAALSALAVILVAVINKRAAEDKKDRELQQKDADEREAARAERDRLLLKMLHASIAQGKAAIIKITQGKTNGELKAAKEAAEEAEKEYQAFTETWASKQINGGN